MIYRTFLLGFALLSSLALPFLAVAEDGKTAFKPAPEMLLGTWIVDLRPKPEAPAYLKKLVITSVADGKLTGTFYNDTPLQAGRINITSSDYLCFAFFTDPGEGAYNTSGRLVSPDRLEGMTLSTSRGFLMPWHAAREKASPASP